MTDPRIVPGYKQKHPQDRMELLLGAILDELIKANASRVQPLPGEVPPETPREASVRVRLGTRKSDK